MQNWYPGDENGKGGIYNFVTKRGACDDRSKIHGRRSETGSAMPEIPVLYFAGQRLGGEFYSVALTNNYQQADTGTKMIHIGRAVGQQLFQRHFGRKIAKLLSRSGAYSARR